MSQVKAMLVAVSHYEIDGCPPLPYCVNDLYAMQIALRNGLNVKEENIISLGRNGMVSSSNLIDNLNQVATDIDEQDTFIFYFSGHGGFKCLALTDNFIRIQYLIEFINKIKAKNKVIILDSCHSGDFSIHQNLIDMDDTVEIFAGKGYAVLASCHSNEVSGFDDKRKISLYTSFVCDALTLPFTVRKGKKSLENISNAIFQIAKVNKEKNSFNNQTPIFRSNIGGTIYFDVEDYHPYLTQKVYEENENYIIYAVEPCHSSSAKRYVFKIILRYPCTTEQISDITKELQIKSKEYEIFTNEKSEQFHKGEQAKILFCYFGNDIEDMSDGNFCCYSRWVDSNQDKVHWYRDRKKHMYC